MMDTEVREMIALLTLNEVKFFYHFTDIDNLPLIIEQGGLKSKLYLEDNGYLERINTGGNELSKSLDSAWGNWDKVSLSFCPRIPMAWHREQDQHLCYVVVKQSIVSRQGVIFVDRNATDNLQNRGAGVEGLRLIDFVAIRAEHPYPEQIKKKKQAEILVPDEVTLAEIESVSFRSDSSLKEGLRLCAEHENFCEIFNVDPRLFIRPSSYCVDHFLTSLEVDDDNVSTIQPQNESVFDVDSSITVLVTVKAHTWSRNAIEWSSEDADEPFKRIEGHFTRPTTYFSWDTLEPNTLSPGRYKVAYFVDGREGFIQQFLQSFTVISS